MKILGMYWYDSVILVCRENLCNSRSSGQLVTLSVRHAFEPHGHRVCFVKASFSSITRGLQKIDRVTFGIMTDEQVPDLVAAGAGRFFLRMVLGVL